jgi:hypothetical protein
MYKANPNKLAAMFLTICTSLVLTSCVKEETEKSSDSDQKVHKTNPIATSELLYDKVRAEKGKELFKKLIAKHPTLDPFYQEVDTRSVPYGFAANIAIEQSDWNSLSQEQQMDIGHFMSKTSPITGWSIAVGRIDGPDIMSDTTGLSSKEWGFRKEPDSRFTELNQYRDRIEKDRKLNQALRDGEPGLATDMTKLLLYQEACDHVRELLKNHSGAKFASSTEDLVIVERLVNKDVEIRSWVDATNSFGKKVRTNWIAIIRPSQEGSGWTLINLSTSP